MSGDGWSRILPSQDGGLVCLVEEERIAIIGLPDLAVVGEAGVPPGSDARMVGTPARLFVLAATGQLYIVDPIARGGPAELAQFKLPPGSRFLAISGALALIATPSGSVIVSADDPPAQHPFPSRSAPEVAAAMRPDHFIFQTGGVLEEWSGTARAPLRRFRLDYPIAAAFLGAGPRFVWFVQQDARARLHALPLVGKNPPIRLDLPEPVGHALGDPTGLQVAMLGAQTGSVFVVNLMSRLVSVVSRTPTQDVAWRGDSELVRLTASTLELVPVPGTLPKSNPGSRRTSRPITIPPIPPELAELAEFGGGNDAVDSEAPTLPPALPPNLISSGVGNVVAAPGGGSSVGAVARARAEAAAAAETAAIAAAAAQPTTPATLPPPPPPGATAAATAVADSAPAMPWTVADAWRDAIAGWARSCLRGLVGEPPRTRGPLRDVATRLGLRDDEARMLALLYGARLCGTGGVAPADLVPVCPNGWADALGTSRLGRCGAFAWRGDRVHLSAEVLAMLDGQPPLFGAAVAADQEVIAPVAVVAPAPATAAEHAALAHQLAPRVGGMFAATERGAPRPRRFLFEARIRGAAPLALARWLDPPTRPRVPVVIVVANAAEAAAFGLSLADD